MWNHTLTVLLSLIDSIFGSPIHNTSLQKFAAASKESILWLRIITNNPTYNSSSDPPELAVGRGGAGDAVGVVVIVDIVDPHPAGITIPPCEPGVAGVDGVDHPLGIAIGGCVVGVVVVVDTALPVVG